VKAWEFPFSAPFSSASVRERERERGVVKIEESSCWFQYMKKPGGIQAGLVHRAGTSSKGLDPLARRGAGVVPVGAVCGGLLNFLRFFAIWTGELFSVPSFHHAFGAVEVQA